ncbi:MAG: winged helix-turn-helix transcriptional regulator [Methanomicrobia archaeon]|nr:winged helix-turn-helix transcriptional regulator [Methanomicrobia archaeon]
MNIEDRLVKEAHLLLHPTRYRIAELLAEKPRHINELIAALGEDRRLVSYHLLTLEEHGFVSSKFDFPQEPRANRKAGKKYGVTDKGRISYQFLILEEEGLLGDDREISQLQGLKGKVMRKYSVTEKAEEALSELKNRA